MQNNLVSGDKTAIIICGKVFALLLDLNHS